MSLPEQLRAIADRIETAEADKLAAQKELWRLAGDLPGDVVAPPADLAPSLSSIDARAESGVAVKRAAAVSPASATPPVAFTCPECGKATPTAAGLVTHRSRVHHIRPTVRSAAQRLAARKQKPTNGVPARVGIVAGTERQPVIRKGQEWYLCSRCPEQFRTREKLVAHLQKGHPAGLPPTKPFGEQPYVDFVRGVTE